MRPSFNRTNKTNNRSSKYNQSNRNKSRNTAKPSKKAQNKQIATNPIENAQSKQNNQIISGYFLPEKPYKEMVIQRVNNFLYGVLAFLVLVCLVCYYFVSCKEVQLNQISRETLELNYENEELQNKIDSLQSYYNIDKAVTKTNILERAKHVVEVDAKDLSNINLNSQNEYNKSLVLSY